jgi:hypothetical protein
VGVFVLVGVGVSVGVKVAVYVAVGVAVSTGVAVRVGVTCTGSRTVATAFNASDVASENTHSASVSALTHPAVERIWH